MYAIRSYYGPGVWLAGARATLKGHVAGKAAGDPWTMPGLFVVQGDRVLWRHAYRHAGDHPNFARIPDRLRSLQG